jgi:glycosyltransferase involved in cell wall biosynthesis
MSIEQYPRISIVTPSFNRKGFIEETMDSVLSQNYPNLEFIVMDGGSTDGTPDIIRRYEKHLKYWESRKDSGPAEAIANGFQHATGRIFASLMSDDLYLPGTLHAVADAMADPAVDVVYGNTYWVDGDGNKLGERRQTPFSPMGYLYGASDLQEPATFWTGDLYRKAGGVDPAYKFAFDLELFTRFVKNGGRFRHINRFLASFRIHPTSKSSTELDLCSSEVQRLREKHLPFPFNSPRAAAIRCLTRARRALWYAQQGDLLWLLGRIPDRIRSLRSDVIVGPRARHI